MSWKVVLDVLTRSSLIARKRTPVVIGIATPSWIKVASATVNGLNAFWIGTLIPVGLNSVPFDCLNASGTNGVAARAASKNERVYLKSANTVKYLSQISRVKELKKLWRSAAGIGAVT